MKPRWLTQEEFLEKSKEKGMLIVVPDEASADKMLELMMSINRQMKNESWMFLNFEGKSDIGYLPVFFMKSELFDPEADGRIQVIPLGMSIPKLVGVEAVDKNEVSHLIFNIQRVLENPEQKKIKEGIPDSQSSQEDTPR